MIITINEKTPSVNHLYMQRGFVRFLTKEAKELKERIKARCMPDNSLVGVLLRVVVEIHENWYYENGNIKKKDVANLEKFLIDSIFEGLGLDDKYIFEITMKKVLDTEEKAIIEILPLSSVRT